MRQDQAIPNRIVRLVEKTSNRCGILRSVEIFSAVSHVNAILANGRTRLLLFQSGNQSWPATPTKIFPGNTNYFGELVSR
jgi:hypothetical protein